MLMAYRVPLIGGNFFRHQPDGLWRENCRGAPDERAFAVEGTIGAWGVREKPPRGGQRRKTRSGTEGEIFAGESGGVKPSRRLSEREGRVHPSRCRTVYRAVHLSEVSSVLRKVANTEPTGSVFKSVRVAAESSHGAGVTSPARNAAGNEPVAD